MKRHLAGVGGEWRMRARDRGEWRMRARDRGERISLVEIAVKRD